MNRHIGSFLAAALSCCLTGIASAAATPVDVFDTPGVPDTGGSITLMGPCYCNQLVVFSPILVLSPGTYDLGTVREYWTPANDTPDEGPDQPTLFLMFQPIVLTGSLSYGFPAQPDYLYPDIEVCAQADAACNTTYTGTYQDFPLVVTLTADDDAVQVGMVGHFLYMPPVPEAPTSAMLLAGLALVLPPAAIARRRAR